MSTADQLRAALAALSLDTRGHKKVLAKRLAKAKQPPRPLRSPPATRPENEEFDSFLVCDVEGTCERIEGEFTKLAFAYPNEIIEFPCILLQWRKVFKLAKYLDGTAGEDPPGREGEAEGEGEDDDASDGMGESEEDDEDEEEVEEEGEFEWRLAVVDEFRSFVKPKWTPKLSPFCTELTGITQADVDCAPMYPELLRLFKASFIEKHALFTRDNKTVWVTDGPWDLRDFIAKATFINLTPRPSWLAGPVVDLKLLTSAYFASQNKAKAAEVNGNGNGSSSPLLRPAPSPLAGSRSPSTPSIAASATRSEKALSATATAFAALASVPKAASSFASPPTSRPSTPLSAAAPAFPAPTTPSGPAPSSPSVRPPPTLSLPALIDALGLPPFEGRQHSGQDDARNAARILVELARRGWPLLANRMVPEGGRGSKERRWGWMRFGKGEVSTGQVDWAGFVERERKKLGAQGAKRFV